MIKFIIVEDEEKWINEYERIINDILFKTDKEYEVYKTTPTTNHFNQYTGMLLTINKATTEPTIPVKVIPIEISLS